ncbi:hypothetical protein [Saccharibacillus sacchari]|uniref:Uncharacterized protein n=1 Tax=Saccharibacillus sacchari TaxID=456493 RepID=A0ACC6PIB9_9BACL
MTKRTRVPQELKDLARKHGIAPNQLYNRLRARWKPELAATTPIGEQPKDRFLDKPVRPASVFPVTTYHWTDQQINDRLAVIGEDIERHRGPRPKSIKRRTR